MEIEKKYKIKRLPEGLEQYEKKEIEQGYLSRTPVLRIRKSNDNYIFTYKCKNRVESESGEVLVNDEIEAALTAEAYAHLREKADNHLIMKTRYIIPLDEEACGLKKGTALLKAELDVFHGLLEGLVFVEVEFPDLEAAAAFRAPDWFGCDVSGDPRYHNGRLTEVDNLQEYFGKDL